MIKHKQHTTSFRRLFCTLTLTLVGLLLSACGGGGGGGGGTDGSNATETNQLTLATLSTGQSASEAANDDGYYQKGQTRAYTRATDIVSDTVTKLQWQDNAATTGAANKKDHAAAMSYCETLNLGGYTDWRLPSIKELSSIVDRSIASNPIASIFDNKDGTRYWSSTVDASDSTSAWVYDFSSQGRQSSDSKTTSYNVRCVRGASGGAKPSFIRDASKELVSDTLSKLQWQDNAEVIDATNTKSWTAAISYCEGLSLGGKSDWRLPNINELLSITDKTKYNPAIRSEFVNKDSIIYWSSTTDASNYNIALVVYFYGGNDYREAKTFRNSVRCVRGGIDYDKLSLATLKTGQSTVYTTNDDGTYQKGQTRAYTRATDIVSDTVTKLQWQDDTATTGVANKKDHAAAMSYCENLNLGGNTDWRLPSIKELLSIVDRSIASNPIASIFDNKEGTGYWSSTVDASDSTQAWLYNFVSPGYQSSVSKTTSYNVRCVRGASGGAKPSFIRDASKETVTDTLSKLQWQDNAEVIASSNQQSWTAAISYCESLSLGGKSDWRLPNINELLSITDKTKSAPAIRSEFVNKNSSSYYWSSTTYASDTSFAWDVYFYNGEGSWDTKTDSYYVRCVRGGQ